MPARVFVDNEDIASALEQIAVLLETQHAGPFRIRAYQQAAELLRGLDRPAATILAEEGREGLEVLPGIGKSLAATIDEFVHSGRISLLDRLEGQVSPEDRFTTIPGIGEALARRIHDELHIETLEELELAAHDGRLAAMEGFGERRVRAIRDMLSAMLSRSVRRRARQRRLQVETLKHEHEQPGVGLILQVDRLYRKKAAAGTLRTITPRRFNPEGKAWLPVMHMEQEGWSFTAMFSNTARAHDLGKTRDWVVIYFEKDGEEDQCTVVTEWRGPLAKRRVVRGRQAECLDYYARQKQRERRKEK
jgi:hypothetical protein